MRVAGDPQTSTMLGLVWRVATTVTAYTWTIFLAAVILYLFWWIRDRYEKHSVFTKLGIPYVKPHLVYGSKTRGEGILATEVIGKWVQEFGKVFGYYVGWKPMLVVADLDLVKTILIKDFHNFSNRPKLVIEAEPVMETVVGLRDQRWKDVRSILAPTFSMMKMKLMAGIMNEKIDELMTIIEEKTSGGKALEWYSTYQGLTLDVISECALAMKTACQRKQNEDMFFLAVRSFMKNAVNPAITLAIYFKGFSKIFTFISNQFALSGRMTKMIVNHLKKVIAVRRNDLSSKNIDVLQLMLEAAESRPETEQNGSLANGTSEPAKIHEKSKHKLLTDKEIIANAWVFLLGGFETTANTLTYTTYLLAQYPDVQERLYQEIRGAVEDQEQDKSSHLTYEQITSLAYMDQVMSETLRLYPPIVTFITREAAEDIQLGNLFIPKDMNIMIPIWQLHRDPEQWENPETFDPERFSAEAKANSTRHPMAYLPFGAGPRNCPGMRFAQLEAKLALARVLLKYRLEPCEDTPNPLTFVISTVAINPAKAVMIKAIPRD